MLRGSWAMARARNESPGQRARPATAWNPYGPFAPQENGPEAGGPPIVSPVYQWNGPLYGASGGWAVPSVWMARILASWCPRPGTTPYATTYDLQTLAAPHPCDDSKSLGGVCSETTFQWGPGLYRAYTPVRRVLHNGGIDGGSTLLGHQFPASWSPADPAQALSFFVAFNQCDAEGPKEHDFLDPRVEGKELFDQLQLMEDLDLFPAGDLFDALP